MPVALSFSPLILHMTSFYSPLLPVLHIRIMLLQSLLSTGRSCSGNRTFQQTMHQNLLQMLKDSGLWSENLLNSHQRTRIKHSLLSCHPLQRLLNVWVSWYSYFLTCNHTCSSAQQFGCWWWKCRVWNRGVWTRTKWIIYLWAKGESLTLHEYSNNFVHWIGKS